MTTTHAVSNKPKNNPRPKRQGEEQPSSSKKNKELMVTDVNITKPYLAHGYDSDGQPIPDPNSKRQQNSKNSPVKGKWRSGKGVKGQIQQSNPKLETTRRRRLMTR